MTRVRKAVASDVPVPAPFAPPKAPEAKKPRPRAPKAQLRKKDGKNPFWNPTDAKPSRAASVTHITDPLLKNLLDDEQKSDRERTKLALDMMRSSPAFFASEVLTGPPQAPYNGRFLVAEHHEEWDRLVTKEKRLCVLAPRDHGKTYFFDFAVPLWKAVFTPNGKGYIFSATAPQAARILEDIKTEIENNPKLQWLLPKGQNKKWSSTSITLANGHKIYARGYGTKVRGAHPDWIVVDDGLNDEDAYSEVIRQKNIDYFYTAITNMCVPGGQIIVVGTPFHAADLYADLEKNKRYCFRRFAAIDKAGKVLWPTRYCGTDEEQARLEKLGIVVNSLESRKIEIGSIRFTREFLCEPISDEMSLFPEKLFRGQDIEVFNVNLGLPAKFWNAMGITRRYVGVDFALSSSTSADYTAIFVLGLDDHGNRWVIDIQRHKGLAYQEQLSLINAIGRKYKPDVIYVEANQMQRIFGDELIRTSDLPIQKFITTGMGSAKARRKKVPGSNTVSQNKNSLEGGVPSLRVLLENRKFRIPRGDDYSVEMTDLWVNEMKAFTWSESKLQGVGSHDDLVMALWIADRAIRDTGFSYGSDDDEDGEDVDQEQLWRDLMGDEEQKEDDEDEDEDDEEGYQMAAKRVLESRDKKDPKKPANSKEPVIQNRDKADPVLEALTRFSRTKKGKDPEPPQEAHAVLATDDDELAESGDPDDAFNRFSARYQEVDPEFQKAPAKRKKRAPGSEDVAARAWKGLPGLGR